jgi:hypothetical protein
MTNSNFERESFKDIQAREKLLVNWVWFKFRQRYPNKEACVAMLFQYLSSLGLVFCHQCNSSSVERKDARTILCLDCRKTSWFTSGTFFDHGKKLEAMIGAICLLESGVNCSANYFAKLANIATSTASELLKKLAIVINEKMAESGVALTSKEFIRLFMRRSRMTPAKEHPSFEQHAFEEEQKKLRLKALAQDGEEGSIALTDTTLVHLSYDELTLRSMLKDAPQNFDQLLDRSGLNTGELSSALLTLETYNFVKRMPGEVYARVQPETSESASNVEQPEGFNKRKILKSTSDFIILTKNGISRKYFQLYSAIYWVIADRERWNAGKILALCSQSKPISQTAIESFVTALQVYVSPILADRTFGVTKSTTWN